MRGKGGGREPSPPWGVHRPSAGRPGGPVGPVAHGLGGLGGLGGERREGRSSTPKAASRARSTLDVSGRERRDTALRASGSGSRARLAGSQRIRDIQAAASAACRPRRRRPGGSARQYQRRLATPCTRSAVRQVSSSTSSPNSTAFAEASTGPAAGRARPLAEVGEGGPGALGGAAVDAGQLHPAHDEDGAVGQARGMQVERAQAGTRCAPGNRRRVPPPAGRCAPSACRPEPSSFRTCREGELADEGRMIAREPELVLHEDDVQGDLRPGPVTAVEHGE